MPEQLVRDRRGNRRHLPRVFRPVRHFLNCLAALSTLAGPLQLRTPFAVSVELPDQPALVQAQAEGDVEWLEAAVAGYPEPWEFSRRLALEVDSAGIWEALLKGRPLTFVRQVTPHLVLLDAPSPELALREAAALAVLPGVRSACPVCRRPAALSFAYAPAPDDDFFPAQVANVQGQWYLENRSPETGALLGPDINIRSAWPLTKGAGVTVAVGDVGIEVNHPELAAATAGAPHFNFDTDVPNGLPAGTSGTSAHGTSCAGLIAGVPDNRIGMSGAAPAAKVASWVVFRANGRLVSDEALAEMYPFAAGEVAVQNHSWANVSVRPAGPTALERTGVDRALREGRDGKGSVIVRIAGNGRTLNLNANDDGWANYPGVICVAGSGPAGRVASYSSAGACILVAAPGGDFDTGGLFTTDLTGFAGANFIGFFPPYEYLSDFRFNALGFSGTSAAGPLVAGVAALVLSANPVLTARDVQQIIALSARHFDFGDPTLVINAAGMRVSHYSGFGVPDAGEAVRLAQRWVNRPPVTVVRVTNAVPGAIPDNQLRVELRAGDGPLPDLSFAGLPGTGPQPDAPTPFLRLVDAGLATNVPVESLAGAGALIERGGNDFDEKLANVAAAGAAFAVIYNYAEGPENSCPPGEQLCPLGGTDFSPIPAIFVRRSAGLALRERLQADPEATVRLAAHGLEREFTVADTLSGEHVQVRLRTDHPLRGDLRIVLTAPTGTRSVLQTYNSDTNAGPADWTYLSTQHFFEPTAGVWRLLVVDEGEGATGSVLDAELILHGTPIVDTDDDGLDDDWERQHFGSLAAPAAADADLDGYSNAREFIAGSLPKVAEYPLTLSFSPWNEAVARLSWPGMPGRFRVLAGTDPAALEPVAEVDGTFPETVWMLPLTGAHQFYRVERIP